MAMLPTRVLRAIFAKAAALRKARNSVAGRAAGRVLSGLSEHPLLKEAGQQGLVSSSTSAKAVSGAISHIGHNLLKKIEKASKSAGRMARSGHPEIAPLIDIAKKSSKVLVETGAGAAGRGIGALADTPIGKGGQYTYAILDALGHNVGRSFKKALVSSSAKVYRKKGLATGLEKQGLSLTAIHKVPSGKGRLGVNKLSKFVTDKYAEKTSKGRKFLSQALGKEPLTAEASDIAIKGQHKAFQEALKVMRNAPNVREKYTVPMKQASAKYDEAIVGVDKLNRRIAKAKNSLTINKLSKQLKEAETNVINTQKAKKVATEKWLSGVERELPLEYKKYKEAKAGVVTAKRTKLLGGTNIKLGPPAVLAGTAVYGAAKGAKAFHETLKREKNIEEYKKAETNQLNALKEAYRRNHPGLSESEVSDLAQRQIRLKRTFLANADLERDMLNTYKNLDRLGGIIPKETKKVKARKILKNKSTNGTLKKLKSFKLGKLFGGKKKKK